MYGLQIVHNTERSSAASTIFTRVLFSVVMSRKIHIVLGLTGKVPVCGWCLWKCNNYPSEVVSAPPEKVSGSLVQLDPLSAAAYAWLPVHLPR